MRLSLDLNGLGPLVKVKYVLEGLDENIFLFSSSFYLVKIMKKKRFIRISKRVMALLLCCSLVSGACFSKYKIEAHATALSLEASAEIMMFLWNLMINGMVVSGAADMVANYDDEKLTFEAFMNNLSDALGEPDMDDAYVVLDDGTKVGLDDYLDGYRDGTVTLPNEQQWGQWRIGMSDDTKAILEAFDGRGTSGPPEDPGDPEPPIFNKLQEFCISIGVIDVLVDTITDLYDGAIEGLEYLEEYQGEECFEPSGYIRYFSRDPKTFEKEEDHYYSIIDVSNLSDAGPVAGYYEVNNKLVNSDGLTHYEFYICTFTEGNKYLSGSVNKRSASWRFTSYYYATGERFDGETLNLSSFSFQSDSSLSDVAYSFNFPVFNGKKNMVTYFETGDDSMAVNNPNIDLGVILSVTPEVVSPLINKPLSPSTLQSTYTGMKSAYQTQIKPQLETETDSEINAKTYQEVMTETLLETVPETSTGTDTEIETKPGTETTPGTGTGSGTGTGTGTGTDTDTDPDENIDVEKYKVDLRKVFPFCIPFDFIALLRVLDAEPEAPRFEIPFVVPSAGINETYVIDLSMFNDAMEVIRLFELVSFVIGLMLLTGKVIKW